MISQRWIELGRGRVGFFGRFQPFHLGHLSAIMWLLDRFREVVVMIGMASESHTWKNPFTAGERMLMIIEALREAGVDLSRVWTVTIPTMEVGLPSVSHVLAYVPPIEAIATANPPVARLFRDAGFHVVTPPLIRREVYRGEYIRELMARGDERWRNLVPKAVARIVDEIGGVERVRTTRRSLP